MKQKFILGMISSLLLASCAQDEMVQMNQNEIRFSAVTTGASRAFESFDSNNSPSQFKVWAWTSNAQHALYIPGDIAARSGAASVWDLPQNRYWPEDTGLDFVAYSGDPDGTFSFDGSTRRFVNYSIKDKYADQLDLIYSVEPGKTASVSPTNLNFRHALSQLRFKATLANPTLKVSFNRISVCNVYGQATYTLPADQTEIGEWSDYSNLKNFNVDAHGLDSSCIMDAENSEVWLSGHNVATLLALLPQQQEAWNPASGSISSGAYLSIDCSIFSVESGSDIKLNSGSTIYIPLTVDWEQGKRYTYNIVFGMGHAGYVNPDSPTETLAGVDLTVTADDYAVGATNGLNSFRIEFTGTPATEGLGNYVITTPNDYVIFTIPKAPNKPGFFAETPQDFNEPMFADITTPLVEFSYWDIKPLSYGTVIYEESMLDNFQPGDVVTLKSNATKNTQVPRFSLTPVWNITTYVTAHYGLPQFEANGKNEKTGTFIRYGRMGADDFSKANNENIANFWSGSGMEIFQAPKDATGALLAPSDDLQFIGWSLTEKPDPQNNNYSAKDCYFIYSSSLQNFSYGVTDHGRLHIYAVYGHK